MFANLLDLPVVTVTVHKTCETTTFFPTYGWVTTNGTTVPYTFSRSDTAKPATIATVTSGTTLRSSHSPYSSSDVSSRSGSGSGSDPTAYPTLSSPAGTSGFAKTSNSLQGTSLSRSGASSVSQSSILLLYTSASGTINTSGISSAPSQTTSVCVAATATPLECPASNGTLYTPAGACVGSEDSFQIYCGLDIASNGLVLIGNVFSEEECVGLCFQDDDCVAVAYDMSDNSCFEKSWVGVGNATADPNLVFAVRLVRNSPGDEPSETMISSNQPTATSPPVPAPTSSRLVSTTNPALSPVWSSISSDQQGTLSRSSFISVQSSYSEISSLQSPTAASTSSGQGASSTSALGPSSASTGTGQTSSSSASPAPVLSMSASSSAGSQMPSSSVGSSSITDITSMQTQVSPIYSTSTTRQAQDISTSSINGAAQAGSSNTEPSNSASATSSSVTGAASTTITLSSSDGMSSSTSSSSLLAISTSSSVLGDLIRSSSLPGSSSTASSAPSSETQLTASTSTPGLTSVTSTETSFDSSDAASMPMTDTNSNSTAQVSSNSEVTPTSDSLSSLTQAVSVSSTTSEFGELYSITSSSSQSPSVTPPPVADPSTASSMAESGSSASPVPSLCPAANMTVYSVDNIHEYTIYCEMSSPGANRTARLANFVECISACDQDGLCTAVSYSGGLCFFALPPIRLRYVADSQFAARVGWDQDSSTTSGTSASSTTMTSPATSSTSTPCNEGDILTGSDARQYRLSCDSDTDGPGGGVIDVQYFDLGDFTQCVKACDKFPECSTWVWGGRRGTGEIGGSCFLKRAPQSPKPGDVGMVAGILVDSGEPSTLSSSTLQDTSSPSTSATSTPLPEPAACPGGNDTIFYDSQGIRYTTYCAFDSEPPAFGDGIYATFGACIEACRTQSMSCVAVGYVVTTCYFKSSVAVTFPKDGVRLAVRAPDDQVSSSASLTSESSASKSLSEFSSSTSEAENTTDASATASSTTTALSSEEMSSTTSSSGSERETSTTKSLTTATPTPTQILINNDFESGAAPWQPGAGNGFSTRIEDGRAVVDGSLLTAEEEGTAAWIQTFDAVDADTPARIQVDVSVEKLDANTNCRIQMFANVGFEATAAQQYVDERFTLFADSDRLSLYVYCRGPAVITFDNAYLILYPAPVQSASTTSAHESSITEESSVMSTTSEAEVTSSGETSSSTSEFEAAVTTTTMATSSSSSELETTTNTTTTTSSSSSEYETTTIITTTTTTSSSRSSENEPTIMITTTTTTDTTTTTSTTTNTSSSTSSSVSPSASCIAEDKSLYQAADGSPFIILCNQGFKPLYLPGNPIQLLRPSLENCLEQCAGVGTDCAGITFGEYDGLQNQCYTHEKMLPSDDASSFSVLAAVRTSNDEGVPGRRQIVQNGGFDGTLSPWESGPPSNGQQFNVVENIATIKMALSSLPGADGGAPEGSNYMEQILAQPVSGNIAYHMNMDVSVESDPARRKRQTSEETSCQIGVQNRLGDTFYNQVHALMPGARTVYGSGTTQQGGIQNIVVNVLCTGTQDVVVRLDNIAFFVFQATGGPDPDCSADVSVLQNGNFDTVLTPWTTSQGSSSSASFSVSGGQALIEFSADTLPGDDSARIAQAVTIPRNTRYSLTADLVFTIASGNCQVTLDTNIEGLYFTGQVTSSQRLPIRFDDITDIDATEFAITVSCTTLSRGINRVGIDSVGFILNPGQACLTSEPLTTISMLTTEPATSTSTESTDSSTAESSSSWGSTTSTLTSEEASTTSDASITSSEEPSSTTSTSSETSAAATCAPFAPDTATQAECPGSDGRVYTSADGSKWMIVCYEDFGGNDRELLEVVTNLPACIDLCMNRGFDCMGVVLVTEPHNLCWIKSRTVQNGLISETFQSAVRMSGPTTPQGPSEVLMNGCFADQLAPWTTSDATDKSSLVWRQDAAYATLSLNQPTSTDLRETVRLMQTISGASAGDAWYFRIQVERPDFEGYCVLQLFADQEFLTGRAYSSKQRPPDGVIDGSGIFAATPASITLSYFCENDGGDTVDTWAQFDDLVFWVYPTSPTIPPAASTTSTAETTPAPTQILINNNFDGDASDPWQQEPASEFRYNIVNGRAILDGSTITPSPGIQASARWRQDFDMLTADTPVRVQADVSVEILDAATWCNVAIYTDNVGGFFEESTSTSQVYSVDRQFMLPSGASKVYLYAYCRHGPASITFDNVYLTLHPAPIDSTFTTSTADPSTTTSTTVSSASEPTASGPTQLIENNKFDGGDYSPWGVAQYDDFTDFVIEDGRAVFAFSRIQQANWAQATFQQYLRLSPDSTTNVGKNVRLVANVRVDIPGTATCFVVVNTGNDEYFRQNEITSSQDFLVDVERMWTDGTPQLSFFFGCFGTATGTRISFDEIYFYTDLPTPSSPTTSSGTTSSSPTPSTPRQLIQNGNFDNGNYDPWSPTHYSSRSELSVQDGRATFSFPRIEQAQWSLAALEQQFRGEGYENAGKGTRFTADIQVNIPGTAKCFILIHSFDDTYWRSNDIDSSQIYAVDVTVIWAGGVPQITLYVGCYGTATGTTISFDNVNFYVDLPTPSEPPTSSAEEQATSTTSTSSSTSATPTVRPTVACPANDAQTYENDDGSRYLIVCGQDYAENNIVGINPVTAATFTLCVDLCMYQGTACVGVSWFENTNCFLKYKMVPSANPNVVVYSAIRISGPAAGPSAAQLVINGNFATSLSPWTTSRTLQNGGSFVLDSGKAYITMPFSAASSDPWDFGGGSSEYVSLSQGIATVTPGQVYFFSAELDLPGNGPFCSIDFRASNEVIISYSYDQSAQHGQVRGSGIFESTSSSLDLSFFCGDYNSAKVDSSVTLDNVLFSVYSPSAGTNPIRAVPAEGLVNNDFQSGSLDPWTTSSTTGRMDFTVMNGRATITYAGIDNRYTSPSWIMQRLNRPVERTQKIRIQADVYINIPNAGTKCTAQVWSGQPVAWTVSDVTNSQTYRVDQTVTLTQGDLIFYLYGSCTGTGASTSISFDNVYLTLNAP